MGIRSHDIVSRDNENARDIKVMKMLALIVLMGVALFLSGEPVFALNPQPYLPGNYFGAITLSTGQSVRINVANLGSRLSLTPRGPCRVLVMIVDHNGKILNGKGRGQTVTLGPGNTVSVQYSGAAETIKVRAVVLPLTDLPWVIQSSLEVLDSTGRTTQTVNAFERLIRNPQPLPPGQMKDSERFPSTGR